MIRMRLLYTFLFLSVLVMVSLPTQAQENKKQEFGDAENYYRMGQIDKALEVLELWLENDKKKTITQKIINTDSVNNISDLKNVYNLSKANRTLRANIYRLAAQCYILEDKPDKASIYIKKMLKIWPDYKERRSNKEDLERFKVAIDSLYTLPKFQVGIRTGINYSFVNSQKEFPVLLNKDDDVEVTRSSSINFQIALIGEYEFTNFASVSLEPSYTRLTHRYEKEYGTFVGQDEVAFNETLEYLEANVLANFKFFPRSKLRLILSAGANYGMLFNATKEIDDTDTPLTTVNFMERQTLGILGRVGGTYRFYGYALGASIGYIHYLNLANDPNNRYISDPQGNVFTYGYYNVPDDFSLSNLQFNVSIRYFLNYKVYH